MDATDDVITYGSTNVFADLGLPNAEERLLKARVLAVINEEIAARGLTQKDAAALLGIAQPDVSKLLHGRLSGFSLERLFGFARTLGNDIDVTVRRPVPVSQRIVARPGQLRVLVADAAS